MIETIKDNKRTSLFGTLTIVCEIIRNNPSLINFLPDTVESQVLGLASLIFAFLTVFNMRDAKTPAQIESQAVQKEQEKQELKTEIKEETAALVKEAKEIVDNK